MTDKALLIAGAKKMSIDLDEVQVSKLMQYLELIIKWNKTVNLSAIRLLDEGVKKHLLEFRRTKLKLLEFNNIPFETDLFTWNNDDLN